MKIEIAAGIELDTKGIAEDGTFEGYASVFGNRDSHGDIVAPGAFTKSLAERPIGRVKMLRQHRQDEPIGIWLAASEDSTGLHVKGRLIQEVPLAQATHALMKAEHDPERAARLVAALNRATAALRT